MGRIRSIRPEFPHSESIGRLSRDARLLFILTWGIADDSGRLRGNSRMLASLLFPYDDDAVKLLPGWLKELEDESMIRRYEVDGQSYIDIPKFLIHQKIDKPSPSKLPAFVEDSAKPLLTVAKNSLGGEGSGEDIYIARLQLEPESTPVLDSPKEPVARFASSEIERIYQAYPRKVGKAAAMKAIKRVLQNLDDPTPVESLLRVVEEYARSPAGNNDVFTPHPATWFNRKSYLDDPKEWDKVK